METSLLHSIENTSILLHNKDRCHQELESISHPKVNSSHYKCVIPAFCPNLFHPTGQSLGNRILTNIFTMVTQNIKKCVVGGTDLTLCQDLLLKLTMFDVKYKCSGIKCCKILNTMVPLTYLCHVACWSKRFSISMQPRPFFTLQVFNYEHLISFRKGNTQADTPNHMHFHLNSMS